MKIRYWKISLLSFLVLTGCSNAKISIQGPVNVWCASAVSKIMREEVVEDTSQKMMKILMAKNETEGAQLMLRSSKDIKAYDVEVTDLISKDFNNIINKDHISIFNTKYISSESINIKYNNPSLPIGSSMPDAILPFDVAKEYGENTLPKDVNQSIYIEVKTDKTTASGIYNGTIKLNCDSYSYYIPLKVEVISFVIPDRTSTKNYFARWGTEHYNSAELACNEETEAIYFEEMLKYKMSSSLPFEGVGGPERYVELLRKYYNYPGFSAFKFFYEATYSYYNNMYIPYNVALCKEYLTKVIEASLEDSINYLDKAFFYFSTFVDEPGSNPSVTWEMVRDISQTVKAMLVDLANELDSLLINHKNYAYYKAYVRNTLLYIPNVIPGSYSIETLAKNDALDITACTVLDRYDSEEKRATYDRDDGLEKWWYTCIGPQYPYPNLLANSYLTGPRLISWMQRYYDVDAFLIWDTNNYTDSDNNSKPVIDNYSYLRDSMTDVSDGKILYPGRPYGLSYPVSSLRAVSYRDGMEDYEIIQAIYDIYEREGLSANIALEDIFAKEFSGTVTNGSASDFTSSRKQIFEMLTNLLSNTALLYKDSIIPEDNPNITNISFIVKNSKAIVTANDVKLESDDQGVYHATLTIEVPELHIKVKVGEKTSTYVRRMMSTNSVLTSFENGNEYVQVDRIATSEISEEMVKTGSKSLKVTLNGNERTGYNPSFAVSTSGIKYLEKIFELSLNIYMTGEVADDYKVEIQASSGTTLIYNTKVGHSYLKQGWNKIDINISQTVRDLEDLFEFRFYFPNQLDNSGTPFGRTLYIDDISYRLLNDFVDPDDEEKGEIVVAKNNDEIYQGTSVNLNHEGEDVSNVIEEINGERYLMLGDFETYNQVVQIKFANNFGNIDYAAEEGKVTHGNKALKMEIVGRGESLRKLDPIMTFFTTHQYFQKGNFDDIDYLEADFFNAMDYHVNLRFSTNPATYFSKYTLVSHFSLKPGMNHVVIDLSSFKEQTTTFSYLGFIFDRGEFFNENRILYMDNFRAHFA